MDPEFPAPRAPVEIAVPAEPVAVSWLIPKPRRSTENWPD